MNRAAVATLWLAGIAALALMAPGSKDATLTPVLHAEMRSTLGIAVFSGMLGVTVFGVFFTPVFYYVIRWFTPGRTASPGNP